MNTDNNRNRVKGAKGSDQSKLRGVLYADANKCYSQAMNSGFYIEAISLCESMITDRIEALLQTIIHHEEPSQVRTESLGRSMRKLKKRIPEQKLDEYNSHLSRIKEWADDRNEAIHSFVKVTHGNFDIKVDDRKKNAKKTAENGMTLFRTWDAFTRKEIVRLKRD